VGLRYIRVKVGGCGISACGIFPYNRLSGNPKLLRKAGRMTEFVVTRVRKELSDDGSHKHIEGVCTSTGMHYTRTEVVDSINEGNTWKTRADGYEATIEPVRYCPRTSCFATPYIHTNPDSTKKDNLENLDSC
jgi:hypothetical protein